MVYNIKGRHKIYAYKGWWARSDTITKLTGKYVTLKRIEITLAKRKLRKKNEGRKKG